MIILLSNGQDRDSVLKDLYREYYECVRHAYEISNDFSDGAENRFQYECKKCDELREAIIELESKD